MRIAVEALNRFECYFLTTMGQLADYLDEVDHPAITGMYDTFHANIEEADPVAARMSYPSAATASGGFERRTAAWMPRTPGMWHFSP